MPSGRRVAGLLLVLLGVALLAWSALRGDLRVGLFLVVPFVYGTGLLPFVGFVLVLVGAFLALTAGFERIAPEPGTRFEAPQAERRTRHGGFVLVGPLPIVWGNDRRLLPWLVLLGVALVVLMLALPMLLR